MNNVIASIENEIRLAAMGLRAIANKYNVSLDFVISVWDQMCKKEDNQE